MGDKDGGKGQKGWKKQRVEVGELIIRGWMGKVEGGEKGDEGGRDGEEVGVKKRGRDKDGVKGGGGDR